MEQKNESKNLFWIILGASFLTALLLIYYYSSVFESELNSGIESLEKAKMKQAEQYARVEVDFGSGKKRSFRGKIENPVSFQSALDSLAQAAGFTYKLRNGTVEKIDDADGSWKIYRNGVVQKENLNKLVINGGDNYTLRRELP